MPTLTLTIELDAIQADALAWKLDELNASRRVNKFALFKSGEDMCQQIVKDTISGWVNEQITTEFQVAQAAILNGDTEPMQTLLDKAKERAAAAAAAADPAA